MIVVEERAGASAGGEGIVTREFQARLLNFSLSGCLVETSARLAVGTVATLRVVVDGQEVADDIEIVRCDPLAGAGPLYHVGARFLWTTPPATGTLRSMFRGSATR